MKNESKFKDFSMVHSVNVFSNAWMKCIGFTDKSCLYNIERLTIKRKIQEKYDILSLVCSDLQSLGCSENNIFNTTITSSSHTYTLNIFKCGKRKCTITFTSGFLILGPSSL